MSESETHSKIDEALVKSLSQILIDSGVTPILWGDYLLTIYGVPSIVGGLEFIVPIEGLPGAISALKKTEKLCICSDPRTCPVSREKDMPHIPSFHMHLGEPASELYVSLWPHSEILGFVPEANSPACMTIERHPTGLYISASDKSMLPGPRPGRGHGALSEGGGQVTVPSSHTMLEAYIRLSAAYLDESHGPFYLSMITYMEEYVAADGLLDEKLLSRPAQTFWQGWQQSQLSMWGLCRRFKTDLEAEGHFHCEDSGVELLT
ncbi:hypothetical protein F5Y16DRAFT_356838 [Xylariaceae sp. FL0255]|nr:hypothetical protein F5Y16DRAFT_356838 [Xylariaceae sp. FL0255]